MTRPVLTFFNSKGGVGKTSLVYHVSWMLADMGHRVLACDLDPQADLTAAYLDEDTLEKLWLDGGPQAQNTIYRCIQPLAQAGDIRPPELQLVAPGLALLPGDLALSGFEDTLAREWLQGTGSQDRDRPYPASTAFWRVAQLGAEQHSAELIVVDAGPNLGAINRSALIASDFVIVPLGAGLCSLQDLRNLGPTLDDWRREWKKRLKNGPQRSSAWPGGRMRPIGYTLQQPGSRLGRPVTVEDRWVKRIPSEYHASILRESVRPVPAGTADPECLATLKPYRSLVAMGREARKPIFHLTIADGATGSHAAAAKEAYRDFHTLAERILRRLQRA